MAEPPPLWRQAFDAAERTVTPRLESLVRTGYYARGAALATWAQAQARHQLESAGARLWHAVNLPAGSDVARLRAQIGALDREVRRLTMQLEQSRQAGETTQEGHDADSARPPRSPGPRPARRRTQRPPGA